MGLNTADELLDLGNLPFHIGVSNTPSNGDLPDVLPFEVGVDSDIGYIVQVPNLTVQQYLERVYRRGSIIGTPMSEQGFGRQYADDFLSYIFRTLPATTVKGLRVLEIGCGSGYLIHHLKQLGADVLGVEPGEQGQIGAEKYGIEIVRSMFSSDRVLPAGRFDVIIHYGVMEHVTDPPHFLEMQLRCLSQRGLIVFAVPDCSDYIQKGDVSMFVHEHWSYFSPFSLKTLVEYVGLRFLHWEKSGFGGFLYVIAGTHGESTCMESAVDEVQLFGSRMKKGIEHATDFFETAAHAERSVGIFCAARIFNLLYLIQPRKLPRFFDDESRIRGRYYPPFNVSVEPRASLLNKPVNELVIMSRSFGSKLKAEFLKEKVLKATRIKLPDDILCNSGP